MDYSQYANAGLENKTNEDVNIPTLAICQKGSAQFDESHRDYPQKMIEGIKPGDIFNTATNTKLEKPILIIPCQYKVNYVEWKAGGSSTAPEEVHSDSSILSQTTKNEKKQNVLSNGNVIQQTYNFLIQFSDDGTSWQPALLRMKSTQIKVAKAWITKMDSIKMSTPDGTQFTPPTFSHIYSLETAPDSNDSGSWFGFIIKLSGEQKDSELANECAGIYESATNMLAESSSKALPA